jgi:hypothetical protein
MTWTSINRGDYACFDPEKPAAAPYAEPDRDLPLDHPEKVISPNDFASPGELSATLLAFVDRYNQAARPFNWNYTATDLARYLGRINGQQQPASMPEAA